LHALNQAVTVTDRPTVVVARTRKGFGILPLLEEEKDLNYHGKPLSAKLADRALALLQGGN
jgi:transketolase